jgi:hypothetical protein
MCYRGTFLFFCFSIRPQKFFLKWAGGGGGGQVYIVPTVYITGTRQIFGRYCRDIFSPVLFKHLPYVLFFLLIQLSHAWWKLFQDLLNTVVKRLPRVCLSDLPAVVEFILASVRQERGGCIQRETWGLGPYAGAHFNLTWGRIRGKTWCMGPYTGVDYNLTLCPLPSRLQHIYHEQPYARVDLNPRPESTLFPSRGLWIWPLIS